MTRRSTRTLRHSRRNFLRHTWEVRLAVIVLAFVTSCTAAQARRAHTGGAVALTAGLVGILASIAVAEAAPSSSDTATRIGVVFVPISVAGAPTYAATDSMINGNEREPAMTARE